MTAEQVPQWLLVDDDEVHREYIHRLVGGRADVRDAVTGAQALEAIVQQCFDAVLLDNRLPDYRAADLIPVLVAMHLQVVVLTGHKTPELSAEVTQLGARDCLEKDGLTFDRLADAIGHPL